MARVIGPTDNDRRVQRYVAAARRFEGFAGKHMVIYNEAAATTLADVRIYDSADPTTVGAAHTGSKVTLDRESKAPLFWFPDGVTTVYGKVGGVVFQLDANEARSVTYAAAAPTTGAHVVGDRVWNTAPAPSGTMGWVCTTAGTPGTWKTFGAITA